MSAGTRFELAGGSLPAAARSLARRAGAYVRNHYRHYLLGRYSCTTVTNREDSAAGGVFDCRGVIETTSAAHLPVADWEIETAVGGRDAVVRFSRLPAASATP